MQIIVNHLTRMQPGYMCVAGIDVASKRHVRPVLASRLTTDLLTLNGGPFDIASLVDLGPVEYGGQVPEVEDYYFNPVYTRCTGVLSPTLFWDVLRQSAQKSLVEIFGNADEPRKHQEHYERRPHPSVGEYDSRHCPCGRTARCS